MERDPLLSVSVNLLSPVQTFSISVLLIDDQPIVAEAIRRMLIDQTDISFHYCSDPVQAIEIATKIKPTVILQDLVMPTCDGILLVKYFKANPATRDIPIIVLSSKEDPLTKSEAFMAGANDYLVKLPDKLEVIARLRYHSSAYIRLLERNEAFKRIEEGQEILMAELADAAAYVRALLPPPLDGLITTEWCFIPSTQLGGDAFGYHWLNEELFAIYLIDVCGHGVGAALLSISVINVLRSQNLPLADFKDPSSVLQALNTVFPMEKHNNMFFTIWYGIYNKTNRTLTYSTGGHPPAILLTGDSRGKTSLSLLSTSGIAIGAVADANFENSTCQIKSYNQLYVFSDGVYEITQTTGEMMSFLEFTHVLQEYSYTNENDLTGFVRCAQEMHGQQVFEDDFSLLKITFNQ